ncbi:MAG: hypothetical protein F6K26_25405 [Moorea sp. SIO2I5]|nr:hypothetical protein [Moorena sp. SIO2I5]
MQRGLGEPVRSWGFPRGLQGADAGSAHRPMRHEQLAWFPPLALCMADNEVYQELRDYGLKPGMKLFLNDLQVTKNNGFGTFNVACKWKRNYRGVKTKEPWYILTNFEDLNTAIVSYKKRFAIEEAMQRGLGEPVRSWGFPRGLQGADAGSAHRPMRHEQLAWFPPLALCMADNVSRF